uniref:Uncharacterized protein n=1 Tax=Tanacetum cinerariifolium TaxID=118510 RepID=A0A6L2P412_TANCI|nr:hypothetical protein [Tanacetum cinerariifolium]
MLANMVKGIMVTKVNVLVFGTSIPLVPFNVLKFLSGERERDKDRDREGLGVKDLRRMMSFLLEWPKFFTTFGLFEFMLIVMPIPVELDLQASLLKVKFLGLLYTFDMLLFHLFLGMEMQHVLVFRLLALLWLLGFMGLVMSKRKVIKERIYATTLRFYPSVFDPLALKALKLDLIAYCSILLDMSRLDNANGHIVSDVGSSEVSVCGGNEKKELLVESRVLIPETTFVGVESRVLIPETTFVGVESRVLIPETTFGDVESRVLIPETTFVGVESRPSPTIRRKSSTLSSGQRSLTFSSMGYLTAGDLWCYERMGVFGVNGYSGVMGKSVDVATLL